MYLRIELLSDTAFGRGDGITSLVNDEVEHDPRTGLPFVKGRTVKGLMIESCADVLYGLEQSQSKARQAFTDIAETLFGRPGSDLTSQGLIHFGAATLPPGFVQQIQREKLEPHEVFEAFTSIRQQTAVNHATGSPKDGSLRATRVVIRETIFHASLTPDELSIEQYALLAACAAGLRHAGLNRSRGMGHIKVTLEDAAKTHADHLNDFKRLAGG